MPVALSRPWMALVGAQAPPCASLPKKVGCHPLLDLRDAASHPTWPPLPSADWDANAGLGIARDLLAPIKEQYPDITHADLWTLAGVVAIEASGGPTVPWKPGRTDAPEPGTTCPADDPKMGPKDIVEDGRLPDGALGADHVREVFTRMGFNDREAVALCGAHTLGRCHPDRSGFDGPWTPEPLTFDNTYFTELLSREWVWKGDVDPSYKGKAQLVDKATGKLMMLPTDWALVADPAYNAIAKEFAASQDAFFTAFSSAFAKLLELGCVDDVCTQPKTSAGGCPHHDARL